MEMKIFLLFVLVNLFLLLQIYKDLKMEFIILQLCGLMELLFLSLIVLMMNLKEIEIIF